MTVMRPERAAIPLGIILLALAACGVRTTPSSPASAGPVPAAAVGATSAKGPPAHAPASAAPDLAAAAAESPAPVLAPAAQKTSPESAPRPAGVRRSDAADADLSARPAAELVALLAGADPSLLRKVCKELGDRQLAGNLALGAAEQKRVVAAVDGWMRGLPALAANDRSEVRQNLQRLWTLSAPGLVPLVESKDLAIAETAAKALIMMRNREVIIALVNRYQAIVDPSLKERVGFYLSRMTEQRDPVVPGRQCLGPEGSQQLYTELIAPVLR